MSTVQSVAARGEAVDTVGATATEIANVANNPNGTAHIDAVDTTLAEPDGDKAPRGNEPVSNPAGERRRRARNRKRRSKRKGDPVAKNTDDNIDHEDTSASTATKATGEGLTPTETNNNPKSKKLDNSNQDNIMNITAVEPILEAHEAYLVSSSPPPKIEVGVRQGGTNRGALLGSRFAYADFNLASERAIIRLTLVDPVPGRALSFKKEVEALGVLADAIEGRVEDIIAQDGGNDPVVLNLDRASGIASVLRAIEGTGRPVLGYLLLVTPNGQLWGMRFVNPGAEVIRLFEELANVSERNASGVIIGAEADPAHALIEPAIRKWFAAHTRANLEKIVAGVEPVSNSFEITSDGEETRRLFVAIRDEFGDPSELAWATTANPSSPLRRGTRFVVAEVIPGSIRLHEVRRRTDDRVTVGGAEVIDRASVEDARRRELDRQTAQALARAERQTLSRRNPVWTTD